MQFVIGTPPGGGRKKSISSSISESLQSMLQRASPMTGKLATAISRYRKFTLPKISETIESRILNKNVSNQFDKCNTCNVSDSGLSPPNQVAQLGCISTLSNSSSLMDNNNCQNLLFSKSGRTQSSKSEKLANINSPIRFLPPELPEETLLDVSFLFTLPFLFLTFTFFREHTMKFWPK